jgi:hypothetical protein
MLQVTTPRLVEITPENFLEVCSAYSLVPKNTAFALSFAYHYKKRLFLNIDSKMFMWQGKPV